VPYKRMISRRFPIKHITHKRASELVNGTRHLTGGSVLDIFTEEIILTIVKGRPNERHRRDYRF